MIEIDIYFPTFGSGGARKHLLNIIKFWEEYPASITLFAPKSIIDYVPETENLKKKESNL